METTLYYTLSTIAQTLGGTVGLLGAFVVFFLQDLDRRLMSLLVSINRRMESSTSGGTFMQELAAGDYVAAVQKAGESPIKGSEGFHQELQHARRLVYRRGLLIRRARTAVLASVGVMIFAVTSLALARVIMSAYCGPASILVIACGGFSMALLMLCQVVAVLWSKDEPVAGAQ